MRPFVRSLCATALAAASPFPHTVCPASALVASLAALPGLARAAAPMPYPLVADYDRFEVEPADVAPAARPELRDPTGELRLVDALALALLQSPDLEVDFHEARAREAMVLQAAARPNPTLSVDIQDFAGTGARRGVRAVQSTLALSQVVELGGKRAARLSVASADVELARWDYEIRRVEVFARTADAFVELLAAQERLALSEDALAIARAVEGVAARRVEAGFGSPAEVLRARVAVDSASTTREHAEHELETARQALAAMWAGRPSFAHAVGDLGALPTPPAREVLGPRIESSPGVARWQAELARREAARAVVRSARTPDVEVAGGARHFSEGDDLSFVMTVSVPLPIFDRKRGAIAEAEQRVAQHAAERRADRVRIATAVEAAQLALVASVEEAKLLRERVLPGIEETVRVLQRGYEEGRFAQVEVLEAERARVETRAQALRAVVEAHHNAREIERLTGAPLEVER